MLKQGDKLIGEEQTPFFCLPPYQSFCAVDFSGAQIHFGLQIHLVFVFLQSADHIGFDILAQLFLFVHFFVIDAHGGISRLTGMGQGHHQAVQIGLDVGHIGRSGGRNGAAIKGDPVTIQELFRHDLEMGLQTVDAALDIQRLAFQNEKIEAVRSGAAKQLFLLQIGIQNLLDFTKELVGPLHTIGVVDVLEVAYIQSHKGT